MLISSVRPSPPPATLSIRTMFTVVPVPVLADNYAYLLLTDPDAKKCAAVDPAEPDKVLAAAKDKGWTVDTILTTHHHADHAGGNEDFVKLSPGVAVYGGDDRIGALTHQIEDGKAFQLGKLTVLPRYTICHTSGSVSYYVTDSASDKKVVFTGDTLFIGGCGRFFEGTPDQMHNSLNVVLGSLPGETEVYCGHEYTTSNLKFAAFIEPSNPDVAAKLKWSQETQCTVPSTIAQEKTFNPFMRVSVPAVAAAALGADAVAAASPVEIMGKLRELKNNFRG
ncbi:hydroxyacylglutathione hydrolase cytoplasmic-like protein [Zopfochytrium polystomum]|nr:hydroxyacylglutathione hydrolase cytoplasmic-like protein [Zopfochytrium polystomum]